MLFLWRSALGGALRHREGVRPSGGMDPQKHSVGCLHGASKLPGRNWFLLCPEFVIPKDHQGAKSDAKAKGLYSS